MDECCAQGCASWSGSAFDSKMQERRLRKNGDGVDESKGLLPSPVLAGSGSAGLWPRPHSQRTRAPRRRYSVSAGIVARPPLGPDPGDDLVDDRRTLGLVVELVAEAGVGPALHVRERAEDLRGLSRDEPVSRPWSTRVGSVRPRVVAPDPCLFGERLGPEPGGARLAVASGSAPTLSATPGRATASCRRSRSGWPGSGRSRTRSARSPSSSPAASSRAPATRAPPGPASGGPSGGSRGPRGHPSSGRRARRAGRRTPRGPGRAARRGRRGTAPIDRRGRAARPTRRSRGGRRPMDVEAGGGHLVADVLVAAGVFAEAVDQQDRGPRPTGPRPTGRDAVGRPVSDEQFRAVGGVRGCNEGGHGQPPPPVPCR